MPIGRNKNIKIVQGSKLSFSSQTMVSYQYQHIDFAKTEIIVTEGLKTDESGVVEDISAKAIRDIMLGKNTLIRMHTIGEHETSSNNHTSNIESPFNSQGVADVSSEQYRTMPCGVQTSMGSIISTPILPNEKSTIIENGLANVGHQTSSGWNWSVVSAAGPLQARVYGYKTPDHYITNKNSRIVNVKGMSDWPTIADRSYELQVQNGSFIFCYDVHESEGKGQGNTKEEQNKSPQLSLQIPIQGNNHLKLKIPPSGQISATVRGQSVSGGMSMPQTDFLPVQCNKAAGMPTKPLFIYPTYGGVIITNSINKNMTQGGGEIFIKFSENGNPIQNLQIDTKSSISSDINMLMSAQGEDEDGALFKWIPAIHQESFANSIKFSVKNRKRIKFQGTLRIDWVKCLGSFAYCPLYFYNKLNFDLYFKGAYEQPSTSTALIEKSVTYKYQLFPIVCENGTPYTGQNSEIEIKRIYDDKNLKESIYLAEFSFQNLNESRYPIQAFGAVVALTTSGSPFEIENSNGEFSISNFTIDQSVLSATSNPPDLLEFVTACQISCGLQGPTGSLTIDSYAISSAMEQRPFQYSVGEIDLDIQEDEETYMLFKGIGLQLSKNNSDNNYQYTINLVGMQQKMQDMKLICAPFWDGDKLQAICLYFQNYLNLPLEMVSHTVKYSSANNNKVIPNALPVSSNAERIGTWVASQEKLISNEYTSTQFRVPRSMNWESPAIDFPTGTPCLQALKTLAEKTSCFFTVGLDGRGYYYELNMYGIPYYVKNGESNAVVFELNELINFSLQPSLNNKYNSIATFGFLQKRFSNGKVDTSQIKGSTVPGSFYTKLTNSQQGNIIIPWARAQVSVQQGFLTKSQLYNSHVNRITFSIAGIYQGSITVLGNTKVNHVYQSIKVGNTYFFVISIEHNIDLSSKLWTTTYNIQKFDEPPELDI